MSPLVKTPSFYCVKRKREEDPLDALVVESLARQRKTRTTRQVFKFAHTVKGDVTNTEMQQRLEEEIERLNSTVKALKVSATLEDVLMGDATAETTLQAPTAVLELTAKPESPSIPHDNEGNEDAGMDFYMSMVDDYMKGPAVAAINDDDDDVWHVYVRHDIPTMDDGDFFESEFFKGKNWKTISDLPFEAEESDFAIPDEHAQGMVNEALGQADEADEDIDAEDWHLSDYPNADPAAGEEHIVSAPMRIQRPTSEPVDEDEAEFELMMQEYRSRGVRVKYY
ncbi:hypothetical protein BD626DRAFT_630829 [Schizophyllum amplum]|uniref:Uncharacterized protein n=1 Tax=Schizophyllum amplum TaxID=97359 RepID=A0A550CCW9_9AGAR|nr:hypothetical protein BD626DRAFT_630829 [Auriculariopsis ampla]